MAGLLNEELPNGVKCGPTRWYAHTAGKGAVNENPALLDPNPGNS
jgi:hypothetical protein